MKALKNKLSLLLILGIGLSSLLGQFGRFETPLGKISWHEIGMTFFLLINGVRFSWKRHLFFLWIPLATLFAAGRLASTELLLNGGVYWVRLMLYVLFAGTVWREASQRPHRQRLLWWGTLFWLALQAVVGIAQYLLFPDSRILFFLGWDDHLSRAFGTLFDPAYFGLLMAIGAVAVLPQLVSKTTRWWALAVFSLCFLALSLSYSRSAYLAYISMIGVMAVLERQRRWLLFIPLLIVSLVLIPKDGGGVGQNLVRTSTLQMRQEVAEIHVRTTQPIEWILGRGWYYESTARVHQQTLGQPAQILPQHSQAVDNTWLHILLSTGVLGCVLLFMSYWQWQQSGQWSALQWALVVGVGVHGLFSLSPLYPWTLLILTGLLVPRSNKG